MLKRIFRFYLEGFKNMTWGKSLWVIILIKLFIMFVIMRVFFMKDFLNERYGTDEEKSKHVLERLTE